MSTANRIARRFSAGFIPDKFFRDQKAKIKAILKTPLGPGRDGATARYEIHNIAMPFFQRFAEELKKFGISPEAERSVDDRVQTAMHVLGKIAESHGAFAETLDKLPWPPKGAEQEIAWSIAIKLKTYWEESFTTLGDTLKSQWSTDIRLIQVYAAKVLKKATPEEVRALDLASQDTFGPASRIKFDFFRRVNLEKRARMFVTKEKVTWDWVKWLDFFYAVLKANYSEQAVAKDPAPYTEFDLKGIKVVVNDSSVGPKDVQKYIEYLTEAYHLLAAKKLSKVWYGRIYIDCESCGGQNHADPAAGVGGNYHIGPDFINIFSRPSSFVKLLVIHELGHRYWFKGMTQAQRGKFESLVKVHKRPRPVNQKMERIPESDLARWKNRIEDAAKKLQEALSNLKIAVAQPVAAKSKGWVYLVEINKAALRFHQQVMHEVEEARGVLNAGMKDDDFKALSDLNTLLVEAQKDSAEVKTQALGMESTLSKQMWNLPAPFGAGRPEPGSTPLNLDVQTLEGLIEKWSERIDTQLQQAVTSAFIGIDAIALALNEPEHQWEKEYQSDPRPVEPVSDYGKSNIDEAFAEVFAHYVLEKDMTRDQVESFRSVLASGGDTVDRLIARYRMGLNKHPLGSP